MHAWFVVAIVAVLLPSGSASAKLCPGGDFVIENPLFPLERPSHFSHATRTVILNETSVSIDDICLTAVRRRGSSVVRAFWPSCGSLRRVRLRVRVTDRCNTITGVIRWKGGRHRLRGVRWPRCGNGFLEPGEECDDRNLDDGDCCTATCSSECAYGEFCEFPTGLCGANLGGTCIPMGDKCTKELHPVCGCDGETYVNDCIRRTAGVAKDHDGRCREVCGGKLGIECPEGKFCEFPAGTCGFADRPGFCGRIPEACTKEFDPVCGCDGRTYGNDCDRRAAGTSKLRDGRCGE